MHTAPATSFEAALRSAPDERPSWIPPDYKVVRRNEMLTSGTDVDALEAWLARVGGHVRPIPKPLLGGEVVWRSKDDDLAYVVPRAALATAE